MRSFAEDHPVQQSLMLWHGEASAGREGHTLLLCRKAFSLSASFAGTLWISASQRYVLYLDGERIGRGPSRSDPDRWGVRSYDLNLETGEHVFAAVVTHRGNAAAKAELGGPGFFLVAGGSEELDACAGAGSGWRSWHHTGWEPVRERAGKQRGHKAVGDGERFFGESFPWGWERAGFDDSAWPEMKAVTPELGNPWGNRIGSHHLREDPLPEMEEYAVEFSRPSVEWPLTVRAGSTWEEVFDVGQLTNAYIRMEVDGGAGAEIELVSCEAPVDPVTGRKGNRNRWSGQALPGMRDLFLPGGLDGEFFETAWFRAFRYLKIRVKAADRPLVLQGLRLRETRFPLERVASFEPSKAGGDWGRMIDVTHRTVQLCAHETTFDCPHYEQGQFGGDSRIQAIYHYLVCDDDRLIRKCIDDLAASRVWLGLLRSHYPSSFHQIIPTFSLHWIGMLHEFRVWRGDASFIVRYLPQAREILAWFESLRRSDGLLGVVPYAPFVDWAFPGGNAPQERGGGSSILTLLYAQACGWMALLESFCGYPELVSRWNRIAQELRQAVRERCLDATSARVADTAMGSGASVHAQTEAALADLLPARMSAEALRSALADPEARQPSSFYYRYHVGMALLRCGAGEDVHGLLEPWFGILEGTGLTTLPENIENPRSDCHAWSVFSGIAPYTHILGLRPDESSSGLERLIWEPHPAAELPLKASFPTPSGLVEARLVRSGDVLEGWIRTPVKVRIAVSGIELEPGEHSCTF